MARAATTSDAFNAVAEPRRRDILDYLVMQEKSVNEIVEAMEMGAAVRFEAPEGLEGCWSGGGAERGSADAL
jgi:hypothetical protein